MIAKALLRKGIQYLGSIALIAATQGCFDSTGRITSNQSSLERPRNVILVIGDGMGPQQLALADLYYQRTGDPKAAGLAEFMRTAAQGSHISTPARSLVNDSACAASQLAGGCLCEPRHVGTDVNGNRCASVAVQAKLRGMKVGLVSDTRLTHATPAAFAAMVADRDLEHSIATQLVESGFDLMLSGGESFFVSDPSQCRGERCASLGNLSNFRQDGRNLLAEAAGRGIQVVSTEKQLRACEQTPVLGLFAPLFMNNAFVEGKDGEPSLAAMTEKALRLLDSPHGFFLMVEAGQIDFAGHANDAGWVLREMRRLSETIGVIERFARNRSDTLVVLTADHETGGMGLSYRRTLSHTGAPEGAEDLDFLNSKVFSALNSQKRSISEALESCKVSRGAMSLTSQTKECLANLFPGVSIEAFGHSSKEPQDCQHQQDSPHNTARDFYPYNKFVNVARVGRSVGAANGIVWATGTHTTTPVLVMAKGPGQERFVGWQHAREVGQKLLDLTRE
jgi:alkaline phosphatase